MRWPKLSIKWFESHKLESATILLGIGLVVYLHKRGAFLAGMPAKMSMQQRMMMNAPSLVKPQMPRMSQQEPERFTMFDHRFEMDRMRHGGVDFRQEFDDDERRRFLPQILSAQGVDIPLIEYIFGLAFNEELAGEECLLQPNAPGIWEQSVTGCWFPVSMADERLIEDISRLRNDRHKAIIVQ